VHDFHKNPKPSSQSPEKAAQKTYSRIESPADDSQLNDPCRPKNIPFFQKLPRERATSAKIFATPRTLLS
jgi:hypothetical protein